MSSINVAFDAGPLYGPRTGVGEATAGMRAALSDHADVSLRGFLVSARSQPHPGDHKLPLPGIVASYLWAYSDLPRAGRWLRPADMVHGTNYVAPPSRLPTVVSVYDCWFLAHPSQASALVRRAGMRLRRRVAEGAWIHASAEAVAAEARQLLGTDRVVTVPLGPPPEVPALGELGLPPLAERLGGRPFVLAVGTHERRKNLPLLITAFGLIADDHPDTLLVLAGGPGDDSAAVATAIDALAPAARARVIVPGFVNTATKHWLLRRAAVLAYPSLYEGFGFPVLEANSAGTPVVASRVGSLPEVAGEAARLVDERTPEAFAAALTTVLSDTAARDALITAGARNLRRFDWQRAADGLVDLYRRAIAEHT